ncbi:hypothetical protein FB567DRAFT_515862 [Paraphoma chrysanthemicola]|uniref:NAD(P)-binding domain-containing protein n=1 Tax=Paraphoma chrysanthemicola TaxID=798071 RepID=A0A8K0RDQ2_9PLEO|nr:hypothetical protein FB567DRAFT_515862 [Paraphoma chrysanthemicola]
MSAYAILGATGSTGSSILKLLIQNSPTAKINLLVRSKAKLENVVPGSTSDPNISIFESSISDISTLAACLKNTKAVFLTVAVVDNVPNTTIAQDTARAVVEALTRLKEKEEKFQPPRLIILSSASTDIKFWTTTPAIIHKILHNAMYFVYTDLEKAEKFLRSQEDWLRCTFIMPGGISHDVQRGHELNLTEQQTFVGFLDVAAAMIEVADEDGTRWEGKNVSLVLKGGQKGKVEWWAPWYLGKGLVLSFVPGLYNWLP